MILDYPIKPEDIKETIESPDKVSHICPIDKFYLKNIEDKGQLIVYVKKSEEGKFEILCADWLFNAELIKANK